MRQNGHCNGEEISSFRIGQSNARGVAILINTNTQAKVEKVHSDTQGRHLVARVLYQETEFILTNIYAPNNDEPEFFVNVFENGKSQHENLIVVGDYNVVINNNLDRKGEQCNNEKSCEILKTVCDNNCLADVWRNRNPGVLRYSYYRKKPRITGSRIDYGLVSAGIESKIASCFYIPCSLSDHSAFFMSLMFQKESRGTGFWKFNNSLLQNPDFINDMSNHLELIITKHADRDDKDKWELIKFQIANFAQDWSREKSKEEKFIIEHLYEKLAEMEDQLGADFNEHKLDIINRTKDDLRNLENKKAEGILFRCKAKWQVEAERNTSYFYSLEKNRYNMKMCNSLVQDNGNIVREPRQILKLQRKFYQKLYQRNNNVKFAPPNIHGPRLSSAESEDFEKEIEIEELHAALKSMKNGKTPGSDGLSVDFYKQFSTMLLPLLHACIKNGLEQRLLHTSARRGILSLIPKANRDARKLKNLRPIALLNVDLKILEKVLANRISTVIDKLIHQHQKGFMKSRRISANICKVLQIIKSTKDEDGLIISVDFQKCFDQIDFEAIYGSLKYFGFGEKFIQTIRTVYTGFTACIQNNGYFSEPFNIRRGVRQGAPNSSFIFLLCAEVMAIMIRENKQIQGIPVNDIVYLLSQYADDFDVFSQPTHQSIKALFDVLGHFNKISGFQVNYDKTTVYRIGSIRKTNAKCYVDKELHWTNDPINILGVYVHHNDNEVLELNYKPLMSKIKAILTSWKRRSLSLIGKVQIINTLTASLFVYRMMTLPTITNNYVKQFDNMVKEFLWDGGRPKISQNILQAPIEHGGLKLVNLDQKDKALKISWIQIIKDDQEIANLAYGTIAPILKKLIWECNIKPRDINILFPTQTFWSQILHAWSHINYQENVTNPKKQIIWNNSHIRIANKPICWPANLQKGLIYLEQLFHQNELISCKTAWQTHGLTIMQYNSLVTTIPKDWRNECKKQSDKIEETLYAKLINITHIVSKVYRLLIAQEDLMCRKCEKLEKDLQMQIPHRDFLAQFKNIVKVTNITKMRSFQYRLLQRSLITNVQLHQWNISDNDKCSFCNESQESVLHLMLFCPKVQQLWLGIEQYMQQFSKDKIHFATDTVIMNRLIYHPIGHVKNAICLFTKYYIYKQRCLKKELSLNQCKSYIKQIENNEKYYAVKNNRISKHIRKWYPGTII